MSLPWTLYPPVWVTSQRQQAPPLGLFYWNRQLLLKKCQSHNDIQTIFQRFTMCLRRRDVFRLKSSANWPLGTRHTSWGDNFNSFLCISCPANPQDKAAVQPSHIPQLWSLVRVHPGHLRALPAQAAGQVRKLPASFSWYTEELCCHEDTEPTCHFFGLHRKHTQKNNQPNKNLYLLLKSNCNTTRKNKQLKLCSWRLLQWSLESVLKRQTTLLPLLSHTPNLSQLRNYVFSNRWSKWLT